MAAGWTPRWHPLRGFQLADTSEGPHPLTKNVTWQGEVLRGGGGGAQGKIISPSSSSSPSSSPEDTDSEGVSSPRAVAAARATPLSRSFYFHERYL
jgi:hypothetical protein